MSASSRGGQPVDVERGEPGPYEILEPLGAGGMGEVYQAEHVLLKRPCAIKLIKAESDADERLARAALERLGLVDLVRRLPGPDRAGLLAPLRVNQLRNG